MQSLKSLLSLIALVFGAIAAIFWFTDVNYSNLLVWTVRIVSLMFFVGIICFLFWLEFLRNKKVDIAYQKQNVVGRIDQLLVNAEYPDKDKYEQWSIYLQDGNSIASLIHSFGNKSEIFKFYASYVILQSSKTAQEKNEGRYYVVSWGRRYDNSESIIKNILVNILTVPFGISFTFARTFSFISIHRLTSKQVRSLKFKRALLDFVLGFSNLALIVLVIIIVCNLYLINTREIFDSTNLVYAISAVFGVILIYYFRSQSTNFGLPTELKKISQRYFNFAGIEEFL